MDPVYLDHNATTPTAPEVVHAMMPYLTTHYGNPSSSHVYGQRARDAVEKARAQVADLIGARVDEVVFTSGGTEANNLAIRGVCLGDPDRRHVITSVIEHAATRQPCNALERIGYAITRLGVGADGRVSVAEATQALRDDTVLVTLMLANNETGTLQPIREIAAAARDAGAWVHTDAAQALGKIPVRVEELGVDLVSIAGHKVHAPKGIGALYVRRETPLMPFLRGACHEFGLRPGTENVAFIVGLGAACALVAADQDRESARLRALSQRLYDKLAAAIDGLALNGHPELRLPNTLSVRFPRVAGRAVLNAAPEIAASTGSACHEGMEDQPSDVVKAMGVPDDLARGTVRLSLGRETTDQDVDRASAALIAAWRKVAG